MDIAFSATLKSSFSTLTKKKDFGIICDWSSFLYKKARRKNNFKSSILVLCVHMIISCEEGRLLEYLEIARIWSYSESVGKRVINVTDPAYVVGIVQ
eukprot:15326537-Ditylum_brightwellii.AAC.1